MNKKFIVAIVLAVGLIASIGCVVSQDKYTAKAHVGLPPNLAPSVSDQNQSAAELLFKIKDIEVKNFATISIQPDLAAEINCYNEGRTQKASLEFYKDGTQIPQSQIDRSGQNVILYYPYSRFPEIMDSLEGAKTVIAYYVDATNSGAGIQCGIITYLVK
jgi:hypothetical protein